MKVHPQYLAGLFDGEGCLYVFECKDKRRGVCFMQARAAISNTHLPTMKAIAKEWGGFLTFAKPASKLKDGNLQTYRLDWSGKASLLNLLHSIQPFLLIKKDQVDLFLSDFAPTMRDGMRKHTNLTPEQRAKRVEVKAKLAEMKKISYSNETVQ